MTSARLKLAGQLWYLSEQLILFTVFDSDVDVTAKRAILTASMNEGSESLKRAEIQLSSVQQKTQSLILYQRDAEPCL